MSAAEAADITAAYEYCRQVAKREAKNFYYAFRVLPKHKSDAMCAVYAFMRKADDLADDESFSVEQRREMMTAWTAAWKASREGSSDLIFLALKDTQSRFGIADALLEELVSGTTLDLHGNQPGVETLTFSGTANPADSVQIYRSFDDLYRYCYLVASVVGLVCIRIFGYSDSKAEFLAERVGIAFQLTNILRDIVEDAQRGRVYLPATDLGEAGVTPQELLVAVKTGLMTPNIEHLLRKGIERAERYYAAVPELVPLLDDDSRVAMKVLATIYHELLQRIAADPAAVLRGRVSVSTSRKVTILMKGLLRSKLIRSQG